MANLEDSLLDKVTKDYPSTSYLLSLYKAWIWPPRNEREWDPSYRSPDGEDEDDVDVDDPHYRFEEWGLRKKRKAQAFKAAAVKRSRQSPRPGKVLSGSSPHNQQLLSKEILSSFNQQFGKATWPDCIREWSNLPKRKEDSA